MRGVEAKDGEIIRRIRGLLALGDTTKNPSVQQAAAAAAKAQELMLKYNIAQAQIDLEGEETERISAVGVHTPQRSHWQRSLYECIARTNFCRSLYTPGSTKMELIGRRHNVELVSWMFEYLVRAIKTETEALWEIQTLCYPETRGRKWRHSFALGAQHAIARRLRAQRRRDQMAVGADSQALVVGMDREVAVWIEEAYGRLGRAQARGVTIDGGAFSHGKTFGATVALNRPVRYTQHRARLASA